MKLKIDHISGQCPVQAEGEVDGFSFYFRARGNHWSFEIGNNEWYREERYGDKPFEAGWMTHEEALILIERAANEFHQLRERLSPKQPSP